MGFFSGYQEADAVRIEPLHFEHGDSDTYIFFRVTYRNGERKIARTSVRRMGGYYGPAMKPWPVVRTQLLGEAYLGILKTDTRLIFLAEMDDGTVRFLQEKAKSYTCRKLLELCDL